MFLDFAQIKADNPIEDVAQKLGLKLTKRNNQLRGVCPSGEGGERAFVITPSKGAWYSFAQQTGGDCIALVSFVNGVTAKEAAQFLHDQSSVPKKKVNTPSSDESKPSEGFKPLEYLNSDHEAVLALGIDPKDAARLGIGFSPRGLMRGKVAIPVRLNNGQLVGYIGISEAIIPPKWQF